MKKASISMIIYIIISYLLTVAIPATEFVKQQKEMFILTADKILIYMVFVILVLSIMEGIIIHSLNKKELKAAVLLNTLIICLILLVLIIDLGRGISIVLRYRFMIFSIVALESLLITRIIIMRNNQKN